MLIFKKFFIFLGSRLPLGSETNYDVEEQTFRFIVQVMILSLNVILAKATKLTLNFVNIFEKKTLTTNPRVRE